MCVVHLRVKKTHNENDLIVVGLSNVHISYHHNISVVLRFGLYFAVSKPWFFLFFNHSDSVSLMCFESLSHCLTNFHQSLGLQVPSYSFWTTVGQMAPHLPVE